MAGSEELTKVLLLFLPEGWPVEVSFMSNLGGLERETQPEAMLKERMLEMLAEASKRCKSKGRSNWQEGAAEGSAPTAAGEGKAGEA